MSSPHHPKPVHEEPRTPGWLTALGISLFVIAGLGWLFTRPEPQTVDEMRGSEAPAVSAAPAPSASAAPARGAPSAIDPRILRRAMPPRP